MKKKYNYGVIRPERIKRDPVKYEPSITEQAGYMTGKQQVERLMTAGANLQASRREQFHFGIGEGIPEGFFDPTVDPGYDRVDAFQDAKGVKSRGKKQTKLDINADSVGENGEKSGGVETKVEVKKEELGEKPGKN